VTHSLTDLEASVLPGMRPGERAVPAGLAAGLIRSLSAEAV
jgi:hypothetical protein